MQYRKIFSLFLIFCYCFAIKKVTKYDRLGKYLPYCTQYRAITTLYIYTYSHAAIHIYIYIYIYIYIHRHLFRPAQDSSVWLRLTSGEQLMSAECSKQQVLSLAKILVVNKQKVFCSDQCIYKFKYVTFELVRSHFR